MDHVEAEGDTIDKAIENALKQLGVERDKITVDILSEGKKGILGFGAQKARIRATVRKPGVSVQASELPVSPAEEAPSPAEEAAALGQRAKEVLTEILSLMGIDAQVELRIGEKNDETMVEIRTENSGLLIGRKGQTLEALQYLVSRIAGERGTEGPHIVVDIENYRQRRRKSLEDLALRLGEKAKRQRKTVTVDALSAADRRIVHAALQDDPWITTKSLGQGSYRRLLIIPEGDRKRKEESQGASQEKPGAKASK